MHTPPRRMTVLIIHYHLRAGGVTRIIHSQVKALRNLGHRVIVASSGPVDGIDAESIVEPTLDYCREGTVDSSSLIETQADLWIIHNPTLGKNSGFPQLIEEAAKAGQRLLLQCHDFAEDGRPDNYTLFDNLEHLYPVAPHVHYAFINRRDLGLLRKAGLPEQNCLYLPNPVIAPTVSNKNPTSPLVFYPVRGIRRKNLGEICLLAANAPEGVKFAVALAPENEDWMEIHDQWVQFARDLDLPIEFNVAAGSSFPDWLARATHLVTTSVAEGFGLTFLEPAFLGKPLIGRNLPEITSDFPAYGTFYESIPVPVPRQLKATYETTLRDCWQKYGRPLSGHDTQAAWESFQESVDFGNLPEEEQRNIIREVDLPDLRQWLKQALVQPAGDIDLLPWSLESYTANLKTIIEGVGKPGPVEWLDKGKVLDQFLSPSRFHFLRT